MRSSSGNAGSCQGNSSGGAIAASREAGVCGSKISIPAFATAAASVPIRPASKPLSQARCAGENGELSGTIGAIQLMTSSARSRRAFLSCSRVEQPGELLDAVALRERAETLLAAAAVTQIGAQHAFELRRQLRERNGAKQRPAEPLLGTGSAAGRA